MEDTIIDLSLLVKKLELKTTEWTTESFITGDEYTSGIADGFRAATQLVKDYLRTSREQRESDF